MKSSDGKGCIWETQPKKAEENMNQDEFTAMVKEMRAAQKDYFRCRAPSLLNRAKKLEKEVDAAIAVWEHRNEPAQAGLI